MSALDVAEYLRLRLRALRMTTTEAAKRSGISRQTWHKLLRADIGEARLSTLVQVADTLETHPLSMLRIFFNGRELSQAMRLHEDTRFVSSFVGDITFPDNSKVMIGETFEKIWEVENVGTEAWEGWHLVCQYDLASSGLQPVNDNIPIPSTQPGERVRLSVTLRALEKVGIAMSHWKYVNADGELVFPRQAGLYCMVNVTSS
ncbi:NBR1-Ig-like domain-containing protein [Thiothrix lacustris]|uniref:NBR1-Ig-like domain-containing protein n=1 Tax=Thiothrix lacustris TaxID=525917 RepID=A0ABY9MTP2_9GAMM|nr:NBR1-Ig-like domain-containing protein [Thiothrix lacustris]WML92036.1 NBR1-Ig-like domain-containing protein [Thiothrix lacustris]